MSPALGGIRAATMPRAAAVSFHSRLQWLALISHDSPFHSSLQSGQSGLQKPAICQSRLQCVADRRHKMRLWRPKSPGYADRCSRLWKMTAGAAALASQWSRESLATGRWTNHRKNPQAHAVAPPFSEAATRLRASLRGRRGFRRRPGRTRQQPCRRARSSDPVAPT